MTVPATHVAARFGRGLRVIRRARRLTQGALAKQVGVEGGYIAMLERGARAPSFELMGRLERALDVDVAEFFLRSEELGRGKVRVGRPRVRASGHEVVEPLVLLAAESGAAYGKSSRGSKRRR